MKNNYVVIMAGGVGSRFWPVSRSSYPKQFIDVLGTGKTLIQSTFERFARIVPEQNIYIVTNQQHINIVKEQLPQVNVSNILGEPIMRNTAACIAYASHKIYQQNADATIVVAPADHLIVEIDKFVDAINKSLEYASTNEWLITLGILPSRPDTGYGYIQYTDDQNEFKKVKTFTEKPDLELAKSFITSGDFLWNAGIFIWSVKSILKAFELYQPEMNELFREGGNIYNTQNEKNFLDNVYARCANISIDFAIMEKAENVYVLPSEFGWSDLGTWASIYDLAAKDESMNVTTPSGRVVMRNSSNCIVNVPSDKLVVLSGLDNYIIVESNNTLLICPRNDEQSVKQIVSDIKSTYGHEYV